LAKIGPVNFEFIGLTGIFKNSQQAFFPQPVGLNYNDTTNIVVVVIVKDD